MSDLSRERTYDERAAELAAEDERARAQMLGASREELPTAWRGDVDDLDDE